ncbi:Por secretion system C-terminal sorting domain-containing protein [Flavobacterium fluvii]|uniref:Por secretion system C-terminal sorting domain-containing protein n=1 Tax=Flavobacterium fluvii TaxID=468056 RepID=A0A1M5FCC2_9FLAO|nr:HYR domain-containing protein [Flavobacterium fluvii]SHF89184.1 Por secretion system C-terminal sorting domain-containing protein [Flavobacterium fluvii]
MKTLLHKFKINPVSILKPTRTFSLLLMVFIFIGINTTIKAQSGIYESYAILNSNGGGNVYYDLQATTGNPDFNGLNLGTFNSSNTLILNGAQNKVYKCNTDDITNGKLYYRIYKTTDTAPIFIDSSIPWLSNDGLTGFGCGGSDQNQTWLLNGANINVLNGLCPGIYYLEIYTTADFTYTASGGGSGTHFAGNGGTNYKASFTVVGTDTVAPATPTLADVNVGQCSGTPPTPTTTDTCAGTITGTTATIFPITAQGTTVVTWTFSDGNGNSTTANQNVTVDDTVAPITPTLANVNVGQCSGTPPTPTTTDACAGTITGTTATIFPITAQGTTIVTWTFNDGNGNSTTANQNVIVDDTVAPATPTLADVNVGQCSGTPPTPTTTDACAGTITGTTATIFPIIAQGTTVVTWTFNDGNGNSTTANQNVIVDDVTKPTLTPIANRNENIVTACSFTIPDYTGLTTASDNCTVSGSIIKTQSPVSGTVISGHNTTQLITITANDGNGNTESTTFTITLKDVTLPTITCPATATANTNNDGAGNCTTIVSLGTPTVSDNCASVGNITITAKVGGITINPLTYLFGIGSTTVVWTATDQNGNVSIPCNQTVTVTDNENPTINCLANVQVSANAGCTATVVLVSPTTADNCSVASVINNAPVAFPLGVTTVTWTVTDTSGNTATCTQTVTVLDQTLPVAICKNISVNLDAVGTASITAADINNNSTDNCGIASLVASKTTFNCANTGANSVILTVTDISGNVSSCTAIVTIVDAIAPTALCKPETIYLNSSGTATLTTADVNNMSSDNCGSVTFSLSKTSFNCANLGANTVTLTVTDIAGNSSSCDATITVVDNIAPVAICKNFTLVLASNGTGTLLPANINNGSTDNCGIATMTLSKTNFTCTDANGLPQSVTLTVTDAAGNSSSCTATVTVQTTLAITATSNSVVCMGNTLNLFGAVTSGTFGTPTYYWTGPLGFSSSLQNPSIANVSMGAAGVYTLTVTNGNGCTTSQTTTVIVNPVPNVSIDPTFTSGFVKKATGQAVLYTYTITNIGSVSDIFDLSAIWINDNANSVDMDIRFKVGGLFYPTPYATASIPPGGTFTFQVELQVQGNAPRVLNHTRVTATSRLCSISSTSADMYTYEYNGNLPPATAAQLELLKTASTTSAIVGVPFDYVITIVNNSSSTDATNVIISDQIPANLTITNNGGGLQSGQTITWEIGTLNKIGGAINTVQKTVTVVPTCASVPSITNTANVFSTPPDNGLGVKVSSITIPVTDNIAPTAICKPITVNLDATGAATITAAMVNNGSYDNCSVQSIAISKSSFNCSNIGANNVTLTVTDVSGNISSCNSVVTVVDNQAPVFTSCPTTPTALCADNLTTYTKVGTGWNALATDNCSLASLTYTLTGSTTGTGTSLNGVAFNVGTTTVTWTATDTVGNTSNCIFSVTINGLPVITTQPITQLDCEGASVKFKVIVSGSGLTYTWQRKRPADASFVTVLSGGNITFPSPEEIKIDNVGSSLSPSGTQYQVVVTNSSGCSVTSSAATLLVNEITAISPIANDVTQCYGTNYSYTVSTSTPPPGYVVSYQWKNSVASGPWNNVVDGVHFSGATTATLNIINGTPAESAEYRVYVTFHSSGADCNVNSSSRARSITFLPLLTASVSISESANSICPGTPVTFTAIPTNGGTTPTYQWKLNGSNVGANSTTATYTNSTLVNGDMVTCEMTSNATCVTGSPATSNPVTMTVNPILTSVSLNLNGSPTVCLSDLGTSLGVVETGGATISSRQWGTRSVSGGIIILIGGQTASTFTPGTGLTAGTWIIVCISTPTCGSPMVSNEVTVTVSTPTVAGTLTPANTDVCSGTYNSGVLTLSGYTGSIIRWESSTDNFVSVVTPITNTGNTQTIGAHTVTTYYRAVVQNGACNLEYSTSAKITVYGAMAAPGGISVNGGAPYPVSGAGISHCASTSTVFSIAPVANATSYNWVIPTGWTLVSGLGTNSVTVITGNNSQSENISVYAINPGCSTNSSYLYLYLVPSSAPQVAPTQPTCAVPTGTITVTSPAPTPGITYTLVGTNPVVAGVTNATGIFSGLAVGAYDVTVNNGSFVALSGIIKDPTPHPLTDCATTTSVTISPLATNTWSSGAWSTGLPPTINQNIVFSAGYSSSSNIDGCSCTVTAGNVVINSGHTLKITNWVHVNGGTLTFENNASLVQINNVSNTNSGDIRYKRLTTAIRNTDYTYWSSPVAGFTLGGVSPNTLADKFYSYDSSIEDWKQESAATSMVSGVGYIIRGPQTSLYLPPTPPNLYQATFVGVPNNGHYEITGIIADKSYLLGNPYPSALDADAFLDANQNVLDGTLYFWTHNTPIAVGTPDPGSGLYAYSGDDYASYNRTGGVSTGAKAPSSVPPNTGSNSNIPSGEIASGQGFFAGSKVAPIGTKIIFDNSMRLSSVGAILDNSQFFKTRNPKEKVASPMEKNRLWLNLTNTQGAFKQTLVGYITDATNNYDSRFDGESFDGNVFLDFYSINNRKNLTIQGRALPFDENDEVPLGYRVAVDGTFTVEIDQTDGVLSNQPVFLEDKLTNSIFDLKSGNYTFNTMAGTFNNRFVLRYKDTSNKTLSVGEMDDNDEIVVLYSNNYKTLIIRNNVSDATVNSVTLFNMSGKKISYWDVKGREQTSIQIPIKNVPSEIYIVKVKTTKGEFSKKIVIR